MPEEIKEQEEPRRSAIEALLESLCLMPVFLITMAILLFIIIPTGIITYFVLTETPWEWLALVGGGLVIIIVSALLIFVPAYRKQKNKKKRRWQEKIEALDLNDKATNERKKQSQELHDFQQGLTKAIRVRGKELDLTNLDWRKTKALLYQGGITSQKCAICKLSLEKSEYIMQCPACQTLYHGEHLVEWLVEQGTCPVCRTALL